MALCSMHPVWMQSLGMVISGPLNTEGSFISFHTNRLLLDNL